MRSPDRHVAQALLHLNEAVAMAQRERDAMRFCSSATVRQRERLSERVGSLMALATVVAELQPLGEDPQDAA